LRISPSITADSGCLIFGAQAPLYSAAFATT
jgi:hypothetical protein